MFRCKWIVGSFLGFLLMLSFDVSANPNLSDDENRGYARACFNVVKHKYHCNDGSSIFDGLAEGEKKKYYEDKYSFWPAEVLSISSRGAVVKAKVEVTYRCEVGGNKGWGTPKMEVDKYVYTCLSENVAKGSFPDPVTFLRDTNGKGFDVWAYQETTPSSSNFFVENKTAQKGYTQIQRDTETRYTDYWNYRYRGLDLAKQYFGQYLK